MFSLGLIIGIVVGVAIIAKLMHLDPGRFIEALTEIKEDKENGGE